MAALTTYAGTGTKGWGADGKATETTLNNPFFCVLDGDGDLYFTDTDNSAVRVVSKRDGTVRTIAGTGTAGYGGDGDIGTKAMLKDPCSLALDEFGSLYILERIGKRIRKISKRGGRISTFLDLQAFKDPHDILLDRRGNLLLADVGQNKAFRIDLVTQKYTQWLPSPVVEPGFVSQTDKQTNTPFSTENLRRPPVALAINFKFRDFKGIRALCNDPNGRFVYVCERGGHVVRRVDVTKDAVDLVAGTPGKAGFGGDGGKATDALLNGPKGIVCDTAGNLFIVDTENHAIRRVDVRTGVISTVAGDGTKGNGLRLDRPHGVCAGADGALFIADSENHRIVRVAG